MQTKTLKSVKGLIQMAKGRIEIGISERRLQTKNCRVIGQ